MPEFNLAEITSHFSISGKLENIKVNSQGHINSTFISEFSTPEGIRRYTHQRINQNVFHKPMEVMENIWLVTNHIRTILKQEYSDVSRRCLTVILTNDGKLAYEDSDGGFWRTYEYIDHVRTYESIANEKQAQLLGEAVGNFQLELSDFDGSRLHETIPHFHDMASRYAQLDKAISEDRLERLAKVHREVDFLMDNRERGSILWDSMKNGSVPIRVTHNDTKMNNVLFSEDGQEALCVIDLDTVMPGTILFDTGDMIRTATNTACEDERDLEKVSCSVKLHHALLSGYRSRASKFLTSREDELITESGRTTTQIMAVRFLTDFRAGDVYYHIERPEHNLDRARTQICLMQDMDRKWDQLR
jgi:Ser/Thr protein kinase RdoA (MazF antagonist)